LLLARYSIQNNQYGAVIAAIAASFALHIRQNYPYILSTSLHRKVLHKKGEPHEVGNPKKRSRLPHDDFRIRSNGVGPLRRNRANRAVIDAQQEPLARPVIAFADTDKLPTGERMERVGYADKLRRSGGKVCIPG
jgi:hypothetical protein